MRQGQEKKSATSDNILDGPSGNNSETSEQRYRELFDDSPVAIWVDD
jgi:hypothetical protein